MNFFIKCLIGFLILVLASWVNNFLPGSWVIIIVLAIVAYFIIHEYNQLVNDKNMVKNAWSKIEVQLNRRADLIYNLVETVKGYAGHENKTLREVIEARSGLLNATTVPEMATSNKQVSNSLMSLFATVEAYPDLKANENFLNLQNQLENTENLIASYRESYNNAVFTYNNSCEQFPSNVVAKMFNFNEADFFESDDESRMVPKVQF